MSARLVVSVALLLAGCAAPTPPVSQPDGHAFVIQESALPAAEPTPPTVQAPSIPRPFARRVYFARGSARLDTDARKALRGLGSMMLLEPRLRVKVVGFASPVEPRAKVLAERRARSVAQFLRDGGIAPDRVSMAWYAKDLFGCASQKARKAHEGCESAQHMAFLTNQE